MKRNVLVVDDHIEMCELMVSLVEDFDSELEVLKASSLEEALKIVNSENLSLVISDKDLPGHSEGIKLLQYVRSEDEKVVRILTTAAIDVTEEELSFAHFYVQKPFTIDQFSDILRKAIEIV